MKTEPAEAGAEREASQRGPRGAEMRWSTGHIYTIGKRGGRDSRRQIHRRIVIGAAEMLHWTVRQHAARQYCGSAVEPTRGGDVIRLIPCLRHCVPQSFD